MTRKRNSNYKNKKFSNFKSKSQGRFPEKEKGKDINLEPLRKFIFLFSAFVVFAFLFVTAVLITKNDQEEYNDQLNISYFIRTFLSILKGAVWRIIHYPSFSQMAMMEYDDNRLTEFSEVKIPTENNPQSKMRQDNCDIENEHTNIKCKNVNAEYQENTMELHDFHKEVCYPTTSY